MAPKQFHLDGPSLEELKGRVLAEHGRAAKIVSAEKVRVGGFWGFFAREHYEITVEVPERTRRGAHVLMPMPPSAGITALLDEADQTEAQFSAAAVPQVSTGSDAFATLMDDLTFNTAAPRSTAQQHLAVPAPLDGAGDLVVIVGRGDDPLTVAASMARWARTSAVRAAGALRPNGLARLEDRPSALAARAEGVGEGCSTFVALGIGAGGNDVPVLAAALHKIAADQVWVAVDAGRKPQDTANWVEAVSAIVPVQAVAVLGARETSSPQTINELGLPVGWVDGERAGSPVIAEGS